MRQEPASREPSESSVPHITLDPFGGLGLYFMVHYLCSLQFKLVVLQ